jgi:hypothetical protein
MFATVIILASVTTIIDVVKHRPPSAFGTQHVALILTAWIPVIIMLPFPGTIRSQVVKLLKAPSSVS